MDGFAHMLFGPNTLIGRRVKAFELVCAAIGRGQCHDHILYPRHGHAHLTFDLLKLRYVCVLWSFHD
jgi:hypothetical protein